jgi:hypothetical protein
MLFGSSSSPGSIPVSQIKEVVRGIHTNVMSKSKQLDPSCVLSVVAQDRTLDLVFGGSVDRDKFFKSLQLVIESQGTTQGVKYI